MAADITNAEVSQEQVNRAGFPRARVFIYGHEVSSDIMSVRVNQASGSLERAPSTCMLTLSNFKDKYLLTQGDMTRIGMTKSKLNGTWQEVAPAFSDQLQEGGNVDTKKAGDSTIILSQQDGPDSRWDVSIAVKGADDLMFPLGGNLNIPKRTLTELANRFVTSSSEEIYYELQALSTSSSNPLVQTREQAIFLSKQIIAAKKKYEQTTSASASVIGSWEDLDIPYSTKPEVVAAKMKNSLHVIPVTKGGNEALNFPDRLMYDYPMQWGDCIFHPNDPVRVALRDPFDPSIWYWSFTGFIDSWTENQGLNKDSSISISCTDVSKMARYATVAVNTGIIKGEEIPVAGLTGAKSETGANFGIILDSNLFSDLTISSILEVLFYGAEAAKASVTGAVMSLTSHLTSLSPKEQDAFWMGRYPNQTLESLYTNLPKGPESNAISDNAGANVEGGGSQPTVANKTLDVLKAQMTDKLRSLSNPSIVSPRGVKFKRESDSKGLNYYVLGARDDYDKAAGAIEIKDLHDWNEVIHHRVTNADLLKMRKGAYASTPGQEVSDAIDKSRTYTIDQTIYEIGTNTEDYPVGGGSIYYLAPAALYSIIGRDALDKSFNGVGSVHSTFKDRLSYIYDLAENIDWRFYSTPSGHLVFEFPFYDYDPQDFWKKEEKTANTPVIRSGAELRPAGAWFDGGPTSTADLDSRLGTELKYYEAAVYESSFQETIEEKTPYDYAGAFSVYEWDQEGFSNTHTDQGVITAFRAAYHHVSAMSSLDTEAKEYVVVYDNTLMPTLGFRMSEDVAWEFINKKEEAEIFCALQLNKLNSNGKNLSVDTVPKFGLMVNRPLYWDKRGYYCNIVSMNHSYVWNGDVSTSINVNNIRAWSGEMEEDGTTRRYRHFMDNDRPFNLKLLLKDPGKKPQKQGAD